MYSPESGDAGIRRRRGDSERFVRPLAQRGVTRALARTAASEAWDALLSIGVSVFILLNPSGWRDLQGLKYLFRGKDFATRKARWVHNPTQQSSVVPSHQKDDF